MKKNVLKVFNSNIIRMFVAIMTTFFLPWILDVESYAYVKLYQLYVSYIGLMHLGFCDGVYLKYGGKDINDSLDDIIIERNTLVVVQLIFTAICVLIGLVIKDFVVCVWGFTVLPRNLRTFYEYTYQSMGVFDKYTRIVNVYSVVTVLFYIILILGMKITNPIIYILGLCLLDYLACGYATYLFAQSSYTSKVVDFRFFFEDTKLGIFLMIGNFANTLFLSIDKWFVKYVYGMESFGHYSFATQLLLVVTMFVSPISLTLYSYFSKRKSVEFEKQIKQHTLAFVFMILFLAFFVKWVVNNFISKYQESLEVFYVLLLAQVISAISTILYVNLYKTYKKQKDYLINLIIIILVSVMLNVIFNIFFETTLGFAYATLVSMVIMLFLNLKRFEYLKIAIHEYIYVCMLIVGYLFFIRIDGCFIPGMLYFVYYFVILYIFNRGEWKYLLRQLFNVFAIRK